MKEINQMNKEELIEFATKFNIFKMYDFPEYVNTRQQILNRMQELQISEKEVNPINYRNYSDTVRVVSTINT